MRLLNICLVFLYLSFLVSGETRSASQAWVDNTEAKFSHSQPLLSQPNPKVADAETPKDPETKHPVIIYTAAATTAVATDDMPHYAPELHAERGYLLTGAPRAPPAIA